MSIFNTDLADFTKSIGACRCATHRCAYRSGESAGPLDDGRKFINGITSEDCRKRCENDPSCSGYNLPVTGTNWCETYTSVGVTGDGRTAFECWTKGIVLISVLSIDLKFSI